jgi:short-subunit dehydrogenase
MKPVAVITGASAGIGVELARVFAVNGHAVALVARRVVELDALAAEIASKKYAPPVVLPLDLTQPDAGARLAEALAARGLEPRYVVNNAGFGLVGPAADLDRGQQLAMIDLNMRALTDLSLRFIDSLARQGGGLLNVASVAGVMPGPGSAVYYASKAFVLSLTEALHRELEPRGIRVTCLCPGPVETEFQARAGVAETVPPWPLRVSARQVATAGYDGLMRGRRIVVPGLGPRLLMALVPRLVPRGVLLSRLESRQLKRRHPAGHAL